MGSAATSLPVPVSPEMNAGRSKGAMQATDSRTSQMAGLAPSSVGPAPAAVAVWAGTGQSAVSPTRHRSEWRRR